MFPNFPNFGKLPTYNFVIELIAPMSRLQRFKEDILDSGYVNLNKYKPEERKLNAGDQRNWRLINWGTADLPKIKDIRLTYGKLIISAECLIDFPEDSICKLLNMYEIKTNRGICLADDESEAIVLSSDEESPLKTKHMTRMQMREAGILKML